MARWKPTTPNTDGVRDRLRVRFAALADRFPGMRPNQYQWYVDQLDAGERVIVRGWQLGRGVPGVEQHGLYEVAADNTITPASVEHPTRHRTKERAHE